jgi:hypothetical protein
VVALVVLSSRLFFWKWDPASHPSLHYIFKLIALPHQWYHFQPFKWSPSIFEQVWFQSCHHRGMTISDSITRPRQDGFIYYNLSVGSELCHLVSSSSPVACGSSKYCLQFIVYEPALPVESNPQSNLEIDREDLTAHEDGEFDPRSASEASLFFSSSSLSLQ